METMSTHENALRYRGWRANMKHDILALGFRALDHRRQIHRDALLLWNALVGTRVEHSLHTGKQVHSQYAIDNRNGNPYLLRKERQTIEPAEKKQRMREIMSK